MRINDLEYFNPIIIEKDIVNHKSTHRIGELSIFIEIANQYTWSDIWQVIF